VNAPAPACTNPGLHPLRLQATMRRVANRAGREGARMGTILVIDDDEDVRAFVRRSCAGLGTVVGAADGAQAVEAARWSRPDVVVMGLGVPGTDGFDAARRFSEDPSLGGPALIALTGSESPRAVPGAREAGFRCFVRMEASAQALVEEIARLLQEKARPACEPRRARRSRTGPRSKPGRRKRPEPR
jgi:CheY-like chemotaxis protein